MRLTKEHYKYYRSKKFTTQSAMLKAFAPAEKISIHRLINSQSDIKSVLRLERNRPQDRNHKIANTYNLLRSINNRVTNKRELILKLQDLMFSDTKRKAIVRKILKRLEK
ncbi:MAG: hypothetical protein GY928_17960 [Colwellia sp.]|nr:hypothetical protein [Colwellia sp.]